MRRAALWLCLCALALRPQPALPVSASGAGRGGGANRGWQPRRCRRPHVEGEGNLGLTFFPR